MPFQAVLSFVSSIPALALLKSLLPSFLLCFLLLPLLPLFLCSSLLPVVLNWLPSTPDWVVFGPLPSFSCFRRSASNLHFSSFTTNFAPFSPIFLPFPHHAAVFPLLFAMTVSVY